MSFFKFRQGGTDASAPPPGKKPRGAKAASASTESVEVMRRRARHRLIGSVVLVLAAVIGFPLVFDTKPRPVSGDIAIAIPSKDATAPLAPVPAASEAAGNGLAEGEEEVVAEAPAQPPHQTVSAAATPAVPEPREPARPPVQSPSAAPVPAPAPRPAPAPPPLPAPSHSKAAAPAAPIATATPASRSNDAERARALLEGRGVSTASSSAPAAAEASQRFVVQVGAFADANKALEVRQRIERSGFKTYTQVAQTGDGPRTRVRVGPFGTRGQAEQAAVKIKGLGLPTSVMGL